MSEAQNTEDQTHPLDDTIDEPFEGTVRKLRKLCEDEVKKEKIIGELLNTEEKYSLPKEHSEERTIFNDSIHGHIELHPLLMKIIDTPQFQRLRNIKQLGAGYWVYPGASHNRFEHSIGVTYLAGCLVNNLQEKQPELKITNRDKLCVQIAGLCHDLGHGPFSHLFDIMFIPEARPKRSSWTHEEASVNMFEHMVNKNELRTIMTDHGLVPDEDIGFIKELIEGVDFSKKKVTGRTQDKYFLYEIVSNKRNGIDVDKWDYFARDCHHLGISKSFDHKRLLKLTRVCDATVCDVPEVKRKIICFRDKEKDNIYDMFCTRYNLHRQAYQHKTVNIIEIMIKDALIKADAYFEISKAIDNTEKSLDKYTGLTDHILEKILYPDFDTQKLPKDTKSKLEEARKILEDITKRHLPKFIKEARLPDGKDINLGRLKDNWSKAVTEWNQKQNKNLKPADFVLDMVKMDHGMKGKDLTENVYFYRKSDPLKAIRINKDEMTSILPERFYDTLVRVYYKGLDKKVREEALECFEQWCDNNFGLHEVLTQVDRADFPDPIDPSSIRIVSAQYDEPNSPDWCTCKNCAKMPTDEENICCLPRKHSEQCIIYHVDFNTFLNETRIRRKTTNIEKVELMDLSDKHKVFRRVAYKLYVEWRKGSLGVDNREPNPSCVVRKIRQMFPDPNVNYVGFEYAS